jgi:hypothetical protein
MPKEVMDIGTFNTRYFAGRLGSIGGHRYHELINELTKYHTWAGHLNGPARQVDFDNLKCCLKDVTYAAASILTASKQPAGSEKRMVVEEVAAQASNQMKWLGRRMHMGMTPTTATTQAKQQYKFGVGAGGKNARLLHLGDSKSENARDKNYWLEFYDKKHRPGFLLHSYWVQWLNDQAACYSMSFWDWLEQQEQKKPTVSASVNVNTGLGDPMNVRYLNSYERQKYAEQFRFGLIWDCNDKEYDTNLEVTAFSGKGWAIFVMDEKNTLYAGSHIVGRFHHSSFLAGKPAKAAGELICTKGKLAVITGKSGHYRPGENELLAAVKVMVTAGVVAPDAALKPGFEGTDWFNAREWAQRNGAGATPQPKAAVLNKVPIEARKGPNFGNSLPPL